MNKQDFLDKFNQDRLRWDKLVSEVGESRMEIPGVMGEWTFKDVVAHLTGWRKRTVVRVHAGCGGQRHEPLPWPAEMGGDADVEDETDPEPINQYIYTANRDRPLREVLEESHAVLDQLEKALAALPESAFEDAKCFGWLEGKPLGESDMLGHLHDEHEPDIYRWLQAQQQQQQTGGWSEVY